jgi:hypothetical protein
MVDVNGYELFNCTTHGAEESTVVIPDSLPGEINAAKWLRIVTNSIRDLPFAPLAPSGRLSMLRRI